MNDIKNNPIKYVKLFAILYLIANVITRIIYYTTASIIFSYGVSFASILGIIISVIPIVLFIIHIFKFYGTKKTQILLPISYIISIVMSFFGLIQNIQNVRYINYYSSAAQALRYGAIDSILNIVFNIIGLGFAIFLLITCFNNFRTLKTAKKIILINAGVSVFSILLGIVLDIITGYSISFLFISSYLISLTAVLSHIAYIIFWLYAVDKRNISPLENDLIAIKQQFENGIITEEQYNQKKTEILNKL